MTVHVVTDSTAYMPSALAEERGIKRVSLYYSLGGSEMKSELGLTEFAPFFDELEAADEIATTSPPSVDDFVAAYEPLLAGGAHVVSIHISSGLSETCSHARDAAERLAGEGKGGERVRVIDSATTDGALAMIALAARAAAESGDVEVVAARASEARHEVQTRFLVDTLEYLRRGGRIGTAAAWIGSKLDVKPILALESEIKAVERVRSREGGIDRLIELARRRAAAGADAWCVGHTRVPEEARQFTDRLREVFRRPPEFVAELGPVLGTHSGPELLSMSTMPSRFLDGSRGG